MSHATKIIKKPWGHEYLAYENDDVGVWILCINPSQQTSTHCHPKKTTGLVVLDGSAEISFLADKRQLNALDKVMIRRGLFHSTKNISKDDIYILEIESPNDKNDLVRLNDLYGRSSKPYEGVNFEIPKTDECLRFESPTKDNPKLYTFKDCQILIEYIEDIHTINNKKDDDLIIFLSGGMVRNIESVSHCVAISGDIGFGHILKQVSNQLDGVAVGTIIMTITKV